MILLFALIYPIGIVVLGAMLTDKPLRFYVGSDLKTLFVLFGPPIISSWFFCEETTPALAKLGNSVIVSFLYLLVMVGLMVLWAGVGCGHSLAYQMPFFNGTCP